MGTLYLVRHGQASFGAADYDQLSALGRRQCVRLGTHWRERGLQFDAALCGTLKRHAQSFDGIAEGLGALPPVQHDTGLNEYDGEAIVRAIHPGPFEAPTTPELVKQHFRLLRQGLAAWMAGQTQPHAMPRHADFVAGVASALDRVRAATHANVLLVSSGGPIATAMGLVLGLAPEAVIDLNMRIRNSAVTEFSFTPRRHALVSFNSVAHLEGPAHAGWITYA